MNRHRWICLVFLVLFPLAAGAQQKAVQQPLNTVQKTGQRIFQQRCGVCHSVVAPAFPTYGPILYKDLVKGNEDAIRQYIREGSPRMPGFQVGMQTSEIDAIIEYLKTVPEPPKSAAPVNIPKGPMDL